MKASSGGGASLECVREKCRVRVEPALGLEKAEKQKPRRVEQRQLATVGLRSRARRIGNRGHAPLEPTIKPRAQCLATEDLDPARMNEQVTAIYRGAHRPQSLGVAIYEILTIDDERADSNTAFVRGPRGDCHLARRMRRQNYPEHVRRMNRHAVGQAGDDRPQIITRRFNQERTDGPRTSRNSRRDNEIVDSERGKGCAVERCRTGTANQG